MVALLFVTLAFLSDRPTVRQSVDPLPILDRAAATYDSVRTLAALFVQVIANPLLGEPDTTRGTLYQRRPNHFAMRFSAPRGDRIVADGRSLWLYTPSTTPGQVIRTRIPAFGTTGPNLIGQFVDHPRERYRARYVRADTLVPSRMADVVELTPKAADLPYTSARIWIDREDGMVRQLVITETSGQVRTVILRDAVVNDSVPDREFRFRAPRGVRVVDQ